MAAGPDDAELRRDLRTRYGAIRDPRELYGLLLEDRRQGNPRVEVFYSFGGPAK